MSDDIQTVQMTHGEAMEALWRRGKALKRLQAENEKLRADIDGFKFAFRFDDLRRLEAENDKLRAALKPFADEGSGNKADDDYYIYGGLTCGDLRAAAAALKETGDD